MKKWCCQIRSNLRGWMKQQLHNLHPILRGEKGPPPKGNNTLENGKEDPTN